MCSQNPQELTEMSSKWRRIERINRFRVNSVELLIGGTWSSLPVTNPFRDSTSEERKSLN